MAISLFTPTPLRKHRSPDRNEFARSQLYFIEKREVIAAHKQMPEMRNRHPRWTEADDKKLRELLAKGRTGAQVGMALRRTPEAVASRAYILRKQAREKTIDSVARNI
jgi:hypothetical protein